MSVFKKLKGTFQNAHQDIVDGLRSLAIIESRQDQHNSFSAREINLDAGSSLLLRYQTNWSFIHSETTNSAQEAEKVAAVMAPMFKIWDEHAQSATNLEHEAKAVSSIVETMRKLHTLLDSLRQDFQATEKELDLLEDVCEEHDFKNRCLEEHKKLAMYSAKKEAEVERLKVSLAHSHAKKVAVIDSAKKVNLRERAKAFMSTFSKDAAYYHTHGHPEISGLSSVVNDHYKEGLNSSIYPDEESDHPGNLELSSDGSYIEDDYMKDYSVQEEDVDSLGDGEYTSAAVIREMNKEDEDYLYKENLRGVDSVNSADVQLPDNTNISLSLQTFGTHNEVIVDNLECTTGDVDVCGYSQIESCSKDMSENKKVYENIEDTKSFTVVSIVNSLQDINNVEVKDNVQNITAAPEFS